MCRSGFHIHFWGVTQGVGFRPHLKRLADRHNLSGRVWNAADGVHVELLGAARLIDVWLEELLDQPPRGAFISGYEQTSKDCRPMEGFQIEESQVHTPATTLIPPDVAICPQCRSELQDPNNRRYRYPFITCTYCGPRYSIIRQLPYDRERTSMQKFKQCPSCSAEYNDPGNRRFHSQTNSCASCGPQLSLEADLEHFTVDIIKQVASWLSAGKIGAVKGAAGYLLLCDATDPVAIQRLRKRKHRPTKPLAVLYPDLSSIEQDLELSATAASALQSAVGPIVLLPIGEGAPKRLALDELAPGLSEIGVMLPAAPLLQLISLAIQRPLVATSANTSGSPIIADNATASRELAVIADFFLHHNREILAPQDDSVLRFSELEQRPIWLRRARGLAPIYKPDCSGRGEGPSYLAFGSDLKHSFCLRQHGNTMLSPYLGDLASFDSQQRAEACLAHLLSTSAGLPDQLLADAHPAFYSTALATSMAEERDLPLIKIQHHEAHFAAVLQEHGLTDTPEDVLGVIWDGTGYGTDGQIWGGEFLAYRAEAVVRLAHLTYFQVLLGDKMSLEPRLSALSLLGHTPATTPLIKPLFSPQEWAFYQQMLLQNPDLQTSSMGRLFDAVAAVLGLADENTYEGEAALKLEQLARNYYREQPEAIGAHIPWPVKDVLDAKSWLPLMVEEYSITQNKGLITLKFHRQCIGIIQQVASAQGARRIAFSGGVWQNSLLVDLADLLLQPDYELLFHWELSPNDENISYGQIALASSQSEPLATLTTSSTLS